MINFHSPISDTTPGQYGEFVPPGFQKALSATVCSIPWIQSLICLNIAFAMFGYNPDQMDITRIKVYLSQIPTSTSKWTYAQISTGDFRKRNYYDTAKNMKAYGTPMPPSYN